MDKLLYINDSYISGDMSGHIQGDLIYLNNKMYHRNGDIIYDGNNIVATISGDIIYSNNDVIGHINDGIVTIHEKPDWNFNQNIDKGHGGSSDSFIKDCLIIWMILIKPNLISIILFFTLFEPIYSLIGNRFGSAGFLIISPAISLLVAVWSQKTLKKIWNSRKR